MKFYAECVHFFFLIIKRNVFNKKKKKNPILIIPSFIQNLNYIYKKGKNKQNLLFFWWLYFNIRIFCWQHIEKRKETMTTTNKY